MYVSRIKWNNSYKRVAHFPKTRFISYKKRAFGWPSTSFANFTFKYIGGV